MNMITCGKPCKHQKDGYCALCGVSEPQSVEREECIYFVPRDKAPAPPPENIVHCAPPARREPDSGAEHCRKDGPQAGGGYQL